ncbi:hypothetical protein CMUS01_04317 [Colletotrichum musicola]|uniref:Uncharacterized protein n=1 Tax=Colletotrichum musicola TaxID=2175873 RepID=A0A8H6KY05_9PEZI|nr:hypothetical protein CMUS01_04317 [Colletotrichum musicola]
MGEQKAEKDAKIRGPRLDKVSSFSSPRWYGGSWKSNRKPGTWQEGNSDDGASCPVYVVLRRSTVRFISHEQQPDAVRGFTGVVLDD